MYVNPDVKSKAELKRLLADGKTVTVYAPGLGTVPTNGDVSLEGPHYPKPHTWYGTGKMVNGKLVSVK